MSATSIGIQVILPKTGTSPTTNAPPATDRAAERTAVDRITIGYTTIDRSTVDRASDARFAATDKQAPPPPGMGKHVDKTV